MNTTAPIYIHLFHGWAQDISIFNELIFMIKKDLPNCQILSYDQGYYNIPKDHSKALPSAKHIVVAYSLGWSFIPLDLLKNHLHLILINPFFLDKNDRAKQIEYRAIIKSFKSNPNKTIDNFLNTANGFQSDNTYRSLDITKLSQDLEQVTLKNIDLSKQNSISIIAHPKDPVSSFQAIENKLKSNPSITYYPSNTAIHGINRTRNKEIYILLTKVIDNINKLPKMTKYNPNIYPNIYNNNSTVQSQSAITLSKTLCTNKLYSFSRILEFGVGTGFLTASLLKWVQTNQFDINDINSQMLAYVKNLDSCIHTIEGSIEEINLSEQYDLITSNFSLQWIDQWQDTLNTLINKLNPNGIIALAFPNSDSFPEWKNLCIENNLIFSSNLSISHNDITKWARASDLEILNLQTYDYKETFPSAIDFFRSLKKIGASYSKVLPNQKNFRNVLKNWIESPIESTYTTSLVIAQKKL